MKKEIELKYWNHTCGDGCCYSEGLDLYINNNLVRAFPTHEPPAEDVIQAVIEHLGLDKEYTVRTD